MLYDTLGNGYALRRRPDPRITEALSIAIGDADSIVNVGAGTGSYEIAQRTVVAIEPSLEMVRQRPPCSAPAVQAVAERLPLRDACVSAATAILTMHHWSNRTRGLEELARIARDRIVILTWDPDAPAFWLTEEYFPLLRARDLTRFPRMSELSRALGKISVDPVPIPHDCIDGFLGAFWRRPHAYLDPGVRSGTSGFAGLSAVEAGLEQLESDLRSGEWERRFGHLESRDTLDVGYRLVVAGKQ